MGRIKEITFEREILYDLLSKSLSRYKGKSIVVTDSEIETLSNYPTKSASFKLSRLEFKEGGQEEIPGAIFFKFYRPDEEKGGKIKSFKREYENEKAILGMAGRLECSIDDSRIRVLPIGYSVGVSECDPYMCFFREFVEENSLRAIADEKENKLTWVDIKDAIRPPALLHVNSPEIEAKINLESTILEKEDYSAIFLNYINRISEANARGGPVDIEFLRKTAFLFSKIAEEYLANPKIRSVICGDLNLYPHHLTRSRILDMGSVGLGPFTADVAVFGSPAFNRILKIPQEKSSLEERIVLALNDYRDNREIMSDILKYPNHIFENLDDDFLMASCLTAVLFGGARKASSTIHYKTNYLSEFERRFPSSYLWIPGFLRELFDPEGLRKSEIEEEVRDNVSIMFKALEYLKKETLDREKFAQLEECLKQARIEDFRLSSRYKTENSAFRGRIKAPNTNNYLPNPSSSLNVEKSEEKAAL